MKVLAASILLCLAADATLVSAQPASSDIVAPEDRPTPQSIKHLLTLMQGEKILQAMVDQMDSYYDSTVNKQLEGQNLTPEQQKNIQARRKAAVDLVRELLSPQSMESLYLKVYSESFTQSEIDGMAAFYSSPAGQAVIAKMPQVAKNTMAEMQSRVREMMPKLQQIAKESADEVRKSGPVKNSG